MDFAVGFLTLFFFFFSPPPSLQSNGVALAIHTRRSQCQHCSRETSKHPDVLVFVTAQSVSCASCGETSGKLLKSRCAAASGSTLCLKVTRKKRRGASPARSLWGFLVEIKLCMSCRSDETNARTPASSLREVAAQRKRFTRKKETSRVECGFWRMFPKRLATFRTNVSGALKKKKMSMWP